jgi:hydrogenase/urease accessory protein HupE
VRPGGPSRWLLLAAAGLLLSPATTTAHPLDEYVQATYITLTAEAVELELFLTPGVEVAPRVLALIDADGNGEISAGEAGTYGRSVLRQLRLAVDGRPLALEIAAVEYARPAEILRGDGTLRLRVKAAGWAGAEIDGRGTLHRLSYHNAHEPVPSSYLVNAYLPDAPITITRQERDWSQHGIEIDFSLSGDVPGKSAWRSGTFGGFLVQGIRHIFGGPDHVLFVIGLLLLPATLGQLLKVVSAFTVAHSITLGLAAFGVVTPPARLVEPAIAASIVVVGAQALRRGAHQDPRLAIAFGFGLLHGFGFAYALREMELPPRMLAWSLLPFNLGVELGQIAIILLVAPALALLRTRARPAVARRVLDAGSILIILAGSFWLLQRLAMLG